MACSIFWGWITKLTAAKWPARNGVGVCDCDCPAGSSSDDLRLHTRHRDCRTAARPGHLRPASISRKHAPADARSAVAQVLQGDTRRPARYEDGARRGFVLAYQAHA